MTTDSIFDSVTEEEVGNIFDNAETFEPPPENYKEDTKPPPDRYAARASGETLLGGLVAAGGTILVSRRIDPPVGRYYQLTSPLCGKAIDNFIAGTFIDTLLQPIFRKSDDLEGLGVLFGGLLIAGYERAPQMAPMLEPLLYELLGAALTEVSDIRRKEKTKQRRAARNLKDIAEEFNLPPGADPIAAVLQFLFQDVREPQPEPEEESAEQI